MYLMSIGKNTVLSDFNTLEKFSTYAHSENESRDFQFYASKPIFIEVDKMSSIEVLRIKQNNIKQPDAVEIQRVRKLNIDNVYCVACGKRSVEEMALGLSTGHVKVYNYKNLEFVHTFKAPKMSSNKTCVLFADYNASDDYIASVLESGNINVYGVKTKTLTDTISLDGNSIMARFHPSKRFHLAIASQKGTVTIFDIQSKRKIFSCVDGHAAPCRDVAMSVGAPDAMISVGYDCVINIYDTRRRSHAIQLNYACPMSTVGMSECGLYFGVGNLKGELITFDMRNTKSCLNQCKVHDCAVSRVAFVPSLLDGGGISFASGLIESVSTTNKPDSDMPAATDDAKLNDNRSSVMPTRSRWDSFGVFCNDMDIDVENLEEAVDSPSEMRRTSFDWNMLSPHASKESNSSNENSNQFQFVNTSRGCGRLKVNRSIREMRSNCVIGERDNSSDVILKEHTLTDIMEEALAPQLEQEQEQESEQELDSDSVCSYDRHMAEEEALERQLRMNATSSSTEDATTKMTKVLQSNMEASKPRELPSGNVIAGIATSSGPHLTDTSAGEPTPTMAEGGDVTKVVLRELTNLRKELNTRFQYLENEIKFNAEQNKWQIFTQNCNFWAKQQDSMESLSNAMDFLMQTDPFVSEFMRLKDENERLKAKLAERDAHEV